MSAVADEVQTPSESQKTQAANDAPTQAKQEATTSQKPECDYAWETVLENPNDSDTWLKLVEVAVASDDYSRVNETYEALLEAYPNTVSAKSFIVIIIIRFGNMRCSQPSAQIAYINHVLHSSRGTKYQEAEGLFKRFLKRSSFVELWRFYLYYVRYGMNCLST